MTESQSYCRPNSICADNSWEQDAATSLLFISAQLGELLHSGMFASNLRSWGAQFPPNAAKNWGWKRLWKKKSIKVQWKCIVKYLYFGHFFSLFYPFLAARAALYLFMGPPFPPHLDKIQKNSSFFRDVFPYLGGRYVGLSTQYD